MLANPPAIVDSPSLPDVPPDAQMLERLHTVESMLRQAQTDVQFKQTIDAARILTRACAILRYKDIQVQAAALVMDAERAIAKAHPPAPPGAGNKSKATKEGVFAPLMVSKMRSAHTNLTDDAYEALKAESLNREQPLTRSYLIKQATAAALSNNDPDATRYSSLPWEGGKSVISTRGTGQWIMSLLPYDPGPDGLYAEPFAGMMSILLNRPRTRIEYANDINGRVQNFWACLRRWPDRLEALLELTPYSEGEFYECRDTIDIGDPLERCRKFCVVVGQGIIHSDRPGNNWAMPVKNSYANWPIPRRIKALANCMRAVRLTRRPAEKFLRKFETLPNAIIYADPPYPGVSENLYRDHQMDMDALAATFNAQQGRVCVSGNWGDWNDYLHPPQWETYARDTYRATPVKMSDGKMHCVVTDRTEIAWVNYDPATGQRL